jgi:hypothetical protein
MEPERKAFPLSIKRPSRRTPALGNSLEIDPISTVIAGRQSRRPIERRSHAWPRAARGQCNGSRRMDGRDESPAMTVARGMSAPL